MTTQQFHVNVKPYIQQILIIQNNSLVTAMQCIKQTKHNKIFNGESVEKKIIIHMFAFGGSTEYTFDKLFSKPITNNLNAIIVNTPHKINYVFITVPIEFKDIITEKYIMLYPFDSQKWKEHNNFTFCEMLSRGVDIKGKTFGLSIPVNVNTMGVLLNAKFIVNCYENMIVKNITLPI